MSFNLESWSSDLNHRVAGVFERAITTVTSRLPAADIAGVGIATDADATSIVALANSRYHLDRMISAATWRDLGPAQAARHIAGVSAHELATTSGRHVTIGKLNKAIADVALTELDLINVWGDGSVVAADGTQVDTFIDNLLAEMSIRYGGTGGIAYHYVSDTYIALFSRFIPVGVWEAVHIIQGLLDQQPTVKPDTIHADTQGQALPVYALAYLRGFELMLRVRNWKDLYFYRTSATTRFRHIEALFGTTRACPTSTSPSTPCPDQP